MAVIYLALIFPGPVVNFRLAWPTRNFEEAAGRVTGSHFACTPSWSAENLRAGLTHPELRDITGVVRLLTLVKTYRGLAPNSHQGTVGFGMAPSDLDWQRKNTARARIHRLAYPFIGSQSQDQGKNIETFTLTPQVMLSTHWSN